MRNRVSLGIALLAWLLLCEAAAPVRAQQQRPRPPCCFNNTQFAGTCSVEPAPRETCATILAYLNNPNAAGKTYCNSTTIRGGWKNVGCKPAR